MSPHKFKDYSMVKMDIDVRVANATADVMGKASGDRHLALFAFAVYGLVIEKWVNPAPTVLAETIISLNLIRRKGDEHFLGCTQLLFIWMKSDVRCVYKRFRQVFVPSTRPIEKFLEIEWPPNQSIEELGESFGSGPEILEEIRRDTNQVGSNLELAIRNLFQPFHLENVYLVAPKKTKISMSVQFKGTRKVRDDVAELTEKILNLEIRLRGRDESSDGNESSIRHM
ncbi:hypothetical protein Gogos_002074 [Gossypium gossypioides]|uniref:Uncharacterized protein n=1 Tax=Gossypium gossypioides TaxID=34282 RepID=A0A7J9CQA3_GOSGO|nr:hypothetical protein [Gossypium gossypioides]